MSDREATTPVAKVAVAEGSVAAAEGPVAAAVDALLARLRAPAGDLATHVQEVEPLVEDLAARWAEAGIAEPSGPLLARARALSVELSAIRTRLEIKQRALARVRRVIEEARGGTYDRAARIAPAARRISATL